MGSVPPKEMLNYPEMYASNRGVQMLAVSQLCHVMTSMSRVCFHAICDAAVIGQCHS